MGHADRESPVVGESLLSHASNAVVQNNLQTIFWRYEVAPFAMISWTSGRHDFARLELRCDKVQDGKCIIEAKHVEIPERIGEFVADTHACGR